MNVAKYRWNNSAAAPVRWGHLLRDADLRRYWQSQTALYPDAQASVIYSGLPQGFLNVLPLVQQLTTSDVGPSETQPLVRIRRKKFDDPNFRPADIVAVGCRSSIARRLPSASSLILPFRIHMIIDIPADPERVRRQVSKSERWRFGRDLRRLGLTASLSQDPQDFEFFYRDMHLPTMENRHGDNKRTEAPEVAFAGIFTHGFLFFVEQDGKRIAGALCHYDKSSKTVTTRLLGVLHGADEHYKSGAFRGVYHLLLQWCSRNDVAHLDLFGTEAFIGKGIFQFKRLFKPRLALPPNHFAGKRLWWRACSDTPAVRKLLAALPVIAVREDDQLEVVYFYDEQHPPRHDLRGELPGVASARDVHLDDFLASASGKSPANFGSAAAREEHHVGN